VFILQPKWRERKERNNW